MSIVDYTYIMPAFMMGLLGGAHCIGMCGGVVCALSASCKGQRHSLFSFQLLYSMGRITTYTMLGAASGFAGVIIAQRMGTSGAMVLRYTSSVLMILAGLYVGGWWRVISSFEKVGQYIWQPLSQYTRYLLPVTSFKQAFLLGSLWGLLPCGMVYSALLFSLSTQQWQTSALVMMVFGMGTLPALLLVGSAMQGYQKFLSAAVVKNVSGVILILFGVVSVYLLMSHHPVMHCCQR